MSPATTSSARHAMAIEIDEMIGIGNAIERVPQRDGFAFPPGTVVVSPDSHWLEGDIWIDRFPSHLRDRAPRMFFRDGGWNLEVDGRVLLGGEAAAGTALFECVPGMSDVSARLRDLDAEGVDKELLFPQRFFVLQFLEDLEQREWCVRAYNRSIAEVGAQSPDRLYGVGVLKWWDPEGTPEAIAEVQELGFKTLMIPISPGQHADGEPVAYGSERMDPFWTAVEESGLPVCFHIGEKPVLGTARGAAGTYVMREFGGMRNVWSSLVFSGVFDRNPGLRIVFVESQLHWIPGALQDADMINESFPSHVEPKLAHPPSWYWRNHCYATFMVDPAGLSMLDRIGADRVMWSTDYPHNESTLGYTRSAAKAVYDVTTQEQFKMIVGGTATRVFDL
jgi:predicted TIM-barrel fold metal-dependent hydrolase